VVNRTNFTKLFGMVILLACSATAQRVLSKTIDASGHGGTTYTIHFDGPSGGLGPIITNMPYSLERTIEHVRTLANGERSSTTDVAPMYRDSLGRRRLDSSLFLGQYSKEGLRIICIRDWIGEYEYILDPVNRVAHRMKMPRSIAEGSPMRTRMDNVPLPPPPASPNAIPSALVESLGTQMIDGFLAEGRRITAYDQPKVAVNEFWVNQKLEFVIRADNREANGVETIESLINVSHAEPDPALFQVPPDYKRVDESGPFTVVISAR
jgi:hypothetical protein